MISKPVDVVLKKQSNSNHLNPFFNLVLSHFIRLKTIIRKVQTGMLIETDKLFVLQGRAKCDRTPSDLKAAIMACKCFYINLACFDLSIQL